jgi:hypothetical protein
LGRAARNLFHRACPLCLLLATARCRCNALTVVCPQAQRAPADFDFASGEQGNLLSLEMQHVECEQGPTNVTLTAAQQPAAVPRCYICVQECLHLPCQRCDKMPASIARLDSYLASQVRRMEGRDAEAMETASLSGRATSTKHQKRNHLGEHTIGAYSTPATVIAAAGAFSTSATVTAESAGRGSPANMTQAEVQAAAEVQAETLVKQDASKTDMHDPSKRVSKKPSPL